MKVIAVSGSPRRGGNSDVAARTMLAALNGLGETEFIRVNDFIDRTFSFVNQPAPLFENIKVVLVTIR